MSAPQSNLDTDTRRQVIEAVAETLDHYYVFPEKGQEMREALHANLASGAYDDLTTNTALCDRLTADLQAICSDKHVRVRYNEEPRPVVSPEEDAPANLPDWIAEARSVNFGFYKAERLPGNVGYLDLRNFWAASFPGAGETAVAAMNLLAHTNALIIDLRRNGGGAPSMIALLSSYLFEGEPMHLNSFYNRGNDNTSQSWTLPYVPGLRTPDKPVYVLTGSYTFSAAEEFTYNLKNLKRAIIIGQTTRGGAHPGGDVSVTPHFRVFVPMGRAVNPISGTNWEGTGVEPDIKVPEEEALDHAYRLALGLIIDKLGSAPTGAAKLQAEEAHGALAEIQLKR